MNNRKNNSIEEEFRASKVYETLSGTGNIVADKIAEGLGKASNAIDNAIKTVNNSVTGATREPYGNQPYKNQTYQNPSQNNGGGQHVRSNNQQTPPPPTGNRHPQNTGNQAPPTVPPGVNYSSQYTRNPVPPTVPPRPVNVRPPRPPKPPKPPKAPKVPVYRNPPPPQYYSRPPVPQYRPVSTKIPAVGPNQELKMVRKPGVAKYYLTGAAAFLYAVSAPMYEPFHFALFGLVTVAAFILSSVLFRGKKQYIVVDKPAPEPEEIPASDTGNSEVDKIIDEGHEYLKKLRLANDAIPDADMSECIDRIEKASAGIFNYIAQNPEKAPQIRKFMNYYLPTTMKLLTSYQRLDSQAVKGENIRNTLHDIDRMLYTVAGAFEKQLDSLFSEEAMDISTDISVFETMLKQEGFVDEHGGEGTTETR